MSFEEINKKITPEERAEIEKTRTLSDAELIKGGAEYIVNEETDKVRLELTEEQVDIAKGDVLVEMSEKEKEIFRTLDELRYSRITTHLGPEEFKDDLSLRGYSSDEIDGLVKKFEQSKYLSEQFSKLKSISSAGGFGSLFHALEDAKVLKIGSQLVESEKIIAQIKKIRRGEAEVDSLPENFGIKNVVEELLAEELLEIEGSPDDGSSPVLSLSPNGYKLITKRYKGQRYPGQLSADHHVSYPSIGATGLRVNGSVINGPLVWCNGVVAIFDTPEGYIKVRFGAINSPTGKTYGEIEAESKERKRKNLQRLSSPKQRGL